MTTVKCRYSHCKHDSKDVDKEEAVKIGNLYYHADCFGDKENRREIIDLFVSHINPNPVYAQLQNVITTIIDKKGISSDFLLFGLRYYINHKIPLNYPQGLHYVVQNKQVIAEYNRLNEKKVLAKENFVTPKESKEVEFEYKPVKAKGFADILGG